MTVKYPTVMCASVAAVAAVVLTACGDATQADTIPAGTTAVPTTVSSTPTTVSPTPATVSPTPSASASGAPLPNCGPNPRAAAINDHIGEVPHAQQAPDRGWQYEGESNYNECADLSYATVELQGGTGSSPRQFMLFHRGRYVGTTTKCAFGGDVTGSSETSVSIQYTWPRPGDSNAKPTGLASASYKWDGTGVHMANALPPELLKLADCQG